MAGIDAFSTSFYTNSYANNGVAGFPTSSGKITKEEAQGLVDEYLASKSGASSSSSASGSTVQSLKKDTANFLDQYSASMKNLGSAADKLRGENLDRLLYTNFGKGERTEETVQKTVDAVQNMVSSYNDTLKLLNDNGDRGSGVVNQIANMVKGPMAEEGMELLGISVNKDGTLSLDKDKLTDVLNTESEESLKFYKDLIGGIHGVADGISQIAGKGSNAQAQKLIENDLASIRSTQAAENPFIEMYQSIKGNAYILNNQAVTGMLMNFSI